MEGKSVKKKIEVRVNSNDSSLNADITLIDNKLEGVNTLCYLDATLTKDGSFETEICQLKSQELVVF